MSGVYLTGDFFFSSRVTATARALDRPLKLVPGVGRFLEVVREEQPSLVLLDLQTAGCDPAALVPQLRGLLPEGSRIVAYGPHVHAGSLAAARAAGCDEVFTQGQFDRAYAGLLESMESGDADGC